MTKKNEEEFEIADHSVDDFVMFRYEMNTIFKKNQFVDENENHASTFFGGLSPLTKVGGF
jgi:hypothetical protein